MTIRETDVNISIQCTGQGTIADIEIAHQWPQIRCDRDGVGRYYGPINREDHLGGLPVNAIPMRGAEPGAWNSRINDLPGFSVGPGIELARPWKVLKMIQGAAL